MMASAIVQDGVLTVSGKMSGKDGVRENYQKRVISSFYFFVKLFSLGRTFLVQPYTIIQQFTLAEPDSTCFTSSWEFEMQNTALDALRVLQKKNSSPVALANLNGQDLLRP